MVYWIAVREGLVMVRVGGGSMAFCLLYIYIYREREREREREWENGCCVFDWWDGWKIILISRLGIDTCSATRS